MRLRQTNYRCPTGEIDLIMEDGDSLVFIEVKTRRGRRFGLPEEAVTPHKSKKLIEVAQTYLQSQEAPADSWRIDVVSVEMDETGKLERIEHIVNAVLGKSI